MKPETIPRTIMSPRQTHPNSLKNLQDGANRSGRKKGQMNRDSASVKAALAEAFDRLGGIDALVQFGQENPALFYALWVRILPTEIRADVNITNNLAERLEEIRQRRGQPD